MCWELIISAADYISWRCVSGPGPCIYPVAALILLYHLFIYSESRWFDICLGCLFLFSRTVRAHCSPQFCYHELRWAVLLISILKNNMSCRGMTPPGLAGNPLASDLRPPTFPRLVSIQMSSDVGRRRSNPTIILQAWSLFLSFIFPIPC